MLVGICLARQPRVLVGNEAQSGGTGWWFEAGASQISSAACIGSSGHVSIEWMSDIKVIEAGFVMFFIANGYQNRVAGELVPAESRHVLHAPLSPY